MLGEPSSKRRASCIESNNFLLIGIGPNRDGMRIMARDGGCDSKVCQHTTAAQVAASEAEVKVARPSF